MSDTYDSPRRDDPEGTSPNTPESGGWSGDMSADQASTGPAGHVSGDGDVHQASAAGTPAEDSGLPGEGAHRPADAAHSAQNSAPGASDATSHTSTSASPSGSDVSTPAPAAPHTPTGVQKTEAVPPMLAPAPYGGSAAGPSQAEPSQSALPGSYLPYSQQYPGSVFDPATGTAAPKRRRSWTTAALAAAAMAGLLLGGLVGGLTGFAVGEHGSREDAQLEQPQQPQPSIDPNQPQDQQPEQGVQQGEKVDSAPGVVLVTTAYENGQGAGTGMIVDKSGIVLTNYHVVTNSSEVTVTVADTQKQYTATVVGHNSSKDIAVLEIKDPPKDLEAVTVAKKAAKKGDSVSAVGNGSGQGYLTSLSGTVTGLDQSITAHDSANSERADELAGLIQTDADVVPGYSGGPLMNADGEVVGVTTAASTGYTSADVNGYAVPIDEAMSIVKKIRSGDADDDTTIGKNPALGVSVSTNNQNGSGGEGSGKGAVVQNVVEGSGAEAAGIQQGDVITHLDGDEVNSASDLSDRVRQHKIGDKVKLKVKGSDGNSKEVEVKLGESSVN
ncbi:MAG: trypsin-like peptidase domain-containing protein [Actinomycetaceae bacterium]|nr:trypsin-like peptidase domain-containing protein [Actinomycetaceae bacterium]